MRVEGSEKYERGEAERSEDAKMVEQKMGPTGLRPLHMYMHVRTHLHMYAPIYIRTYVYIHIFICF